MILIVIDLDFFDFKTGHMLNFYQKSSLHAYKRYVDRKSYTVYKLMCNNFTTYFFISIWNFGIRLGYA